MVTVRDTLLGIQDRFAQAGLDTPALDARLLMQAALTMRHEDIILDGALSLAPDELDKLEVLVARRLKREPVARILGTRAFWKADFKVTPATLDPRADSETLIEAVLSHIDKGKPLRLLDLGTGTGCLLLSLLTEMPEAEGEGIDINPDAVKIASENAAALRLETRSLFMVNTFSHFRPARLFDIVISNPPYIPAGDIAKLAPEVRDYDPLAALSGGADGLDCYREIIAAMPHLLTRDGWLFLEIGADQKESVKQTLAAGGLSVVQTLTDLAGHNRCIIARWMKA